MTPNNRPPIVRHIDNRGKPVVLVPLDPRGDSWAITEAADFDALPAELKTAAWFMNDSGNGYEYVKAGIDGASGNLVIVARILLGARRGQALCFLGNDRRDLRRTNVTLKKDGRAKRDHRQEIIGRRKALPLAA